MKKTFHTVLAVLTAAALFVPTLVWAKDIPVDWTVTFTKDEELSSNFDSKEINEVIGAMQPGDTAIFTVNVVSEHGDASDWYLKNSVVQALEESTKAAKAGGGAYAYTLTYKGNSSSEYDKELFNSDMVGGDSSADDPEGLKQATSSLEEWAYLGTLSTGESGKIELTVSLDGESQGNRYQDTVADILIQLAVEVPDEVEPTPTEKPDKPDQPTPTPRIKVIKNGDKAVKTKTPTTRPKTGDAQKPYLYFGIMGAAGVILLLVTLISITRRRKEAAEKEGGPSNE